MLALHVLASGSRGNAAIVEDTARGRGVLVDCGISKKALFERCAEVGFDPARIEAVLVTHEHIDHTKGLGVALRGLAKLSTHPPVYANAMVRRASREIAQLEGSFPFYDLREGGVVEAGGIAVHPFATSHDAAASFGFRFEGEKGDAIGFMTDTGCVPAAAPAHLSGCRILAIEANHDARLLEEGPYPYSVKRRIASDRGHLSNSQSAELLGALLHDDLEQVVALHISETNNTYRLPADALAAALRREGHAAQAQAAYQNRVVSVR